jgi:DNA invertase Pin-like site-specific DNA recombinase
MPPAEAPAPRPVRCAIYTRKSTEEGLHQEFSSLDAQRECAEAYILSQRPQGWTALPEHYDDGGFSGANLARPALQRLLADIQAGKVDCIVIYKVDRLSRSLFDFARVMQILEKHGVSFVSVTQQLNSNTPMGRLTLNVLLSFAQFEREIISERTRDKQSAARRKGKWTGGYPMLGYDADSSRGRLVVNEGEAGQVLEIFGLFLHNGSLDTTLTEMQQRGWQMKSWTTRKGQVHVGRPFDRAALVRLLSNVLYRGEVRHQGKVYAGEQAAIIEREIWQQAQGLLRQRRRGEQVRKPSGALLQDLLRCGVCGSRMVPGYTTKRNRRYGYYVCCKAQQVGAAACPGQSIPAARIEEALLAGLQEWAAAAAGQPLREALQGWSGLERGVRQRRLASVLERIDYDGRRGEASVCWRAPLLDAEPVSIPIRKRAATPPSPPPPGESEVALAGRLPRITRLLALAVRFEGLLQDGTVRDYAELGRLGGVSRARITQIMSLRNLAPVIQERILSLPAVWSRADVVNEHLLRGVAQCLDWREQIRMWEKLEREQGKSAQGGKGEGPASNADHPADKTFLQPSA